jgi:23S rRNA (uracil1939-C5)-methyltransferase
MSEMHVAIEKMVFGGAGFGHLGGKACFVPFTAPGDEAAIRVVTDKRSYLEGEVVELVTASPRRTSPHCPIFGRCGGCNWQHLSYDEQLSQKEEIFAEFLRRAGRFGRERIAPIVAAPDTYGYRSRVQFKVRSVAGELHLGFYRAGSHFVVDVPNCCAIASPAINGLFGELRAALAVFPEAERIPQIDVATGEDGTSILTFHYIGDKPEEFLTFLCDAATLLPSAGGILLQQGKKRTLEMVSGVGSLAYRIPADFLPGLAETVLSFRGGAFSQVNYHQNLALIALVHQLTGLTGGERVLDLFCGNGNFAVPLARYAAEVIGIEAYEPSLEDAVGNARANGITNAVFACGDAAAEVQRLAAVGERFDVVILDPPRTGTPEVVRHIHALKPRAVIYISCDPATLARDIGTLQKSGFEVVKSCPVDMFPQTYHIESVTLLVPAAEVCSKYQFTGG